MTRYPNRMEAVAPAPIPSVAMSLDPAVKAYPGAIRIAKCNSVSLLLNVDRRLAVAALASFTGDA